MTENLPIDQLYLELEDAHQRSIQYYSQGDTRKYLFWLDRWDFIRDVIYNRTH